jgi:hypothetical protein
MKLMLPLAVRDPSHPNRIARPMLPGEKVPRVPCMIEQILACFAELEYITCAPVVDLEHDEEDLDFLLDLAV